MVVGKHLKFIARTTAAQEGNLEGGHKTLHSTVTTDGPTADVKPQVGLSEAVLPWRFHGRRAGEPGGRPAAGNRW